jgi:hypothetical protein
VINIGRSIVTTKKNTSHKHSYVFTDKELKILYDRASGKVTDRSGQYTLRVKPKVIELLDFWLGDPRAMNLLREALKSKKNK